MNMDKMPTQMAFQMLVVLVTIRKPLSSVCKELQLSSSVLIKEKKSPRDFKDLIVVATDINLIATVQ